MTLIKETINTQWNKLEIFKFLRFLESEKIIDKKILKSIKNEMLQAYYSNYYNKEKLKTHNKINDKKNSKIKESIKKYNIKLKENEKKIKNLRDELDHLKKIRWKLYFRNKMRKYTNIFLSNTKKSTKQKTYEILLSNNTKQQDIRYKEIKGLRLENIKIHNKQKILKQECKLYSMLSEKKQVKNSTLKDYITWKKNWWINKVIKRIDSVNWRENDSQKEKLKKIIWDNYKNTEKCRHEDDIYKIAKSLKSYIDENFENIVNELDWIQEKIIELTLKKSKIKEKIKLWEIEDIIWLKEEEYQHQIEIMKLKKEYDEIKYKINEKLKAYDWSTFEEKKNEFLKKKI